MCCKLCYSSHAFLPSSFSSPLPQPSPLQNFFCLHSRSEYLDAFGGFLLSLLPLLLLLFLLPLLSLLLPLLSSPSSPPPPPPPPPPPLPSCSMCAVLHQHSHGHGSGNNIRDQKMVCFSPLFHLLLFLFSLPSFSSSPSFPHLSFLSSHPSHLNSSSGFLPLLYCLPLSCRFPFPSFLLLFLLPLLPLPNISPWQERAIRTSTCGLRSSMSSEI